jgi:hypothetical protein
VGKSDVFAGLTMYCCKKNQRAKLTTLFACVDSRVCRHTVKWEEQHEKKESRRFFYVLKNRVLSSPQLVSECRSHFRWRVREREMNLNFKCLACLTVLRFFRSALLKRITSFATITFNGWLSQVKRVCLMHTQQVCVDLFYLMSSSSLLCVLN